MLTLESAWKAYLNGDIGPWEFQEVVEELGFVGWTGTEDGKVIVHSAW